MACLVFLKTGRAIFVATLARAWTFYLQWTGRAIFCSYARQSVVLLSAVDSQFAAGFLENGSIRRNHRLATVATLGVVTAFLLSLLPQPFRANVCRLPIRTESGTICLGNFLVPFTFNNAVIVPTDRNRCSQKYSECSLALYCCCAC